jgi:hypothetical protein
MRHLLLLLFVVACAWPAEAQDGAAVCRQQCALCHDSDAATIRAHRRDVLAAFTVERIVDALQSVSTLMPKGRCCGRGASAEAASSAGPSGDRTTAAPPRVHRKR